MGRPPRRVGGHRGHALPAAGLVPEPPQSPPQPGQHRGTRKRSWPRWRQRPPRVRRGRRGLTHRRCSGHQRAWPGRSGGAEGTFIRANPVLAPCTSSRHDPATGSGSALAADRAGRARRKRAQPGVRVLDPAVHARRRSERPLWDQGRVPLKLTDSDVHGGWVGAGGARGGLGWGRARPLCRHADHGRTQTDGATQSAALFEPTRRRPRRREASSPTARQRCHASGRKPPAASTLTGGLQRVARMSAVLAGRACATATATATALDVPDRRSSGASIGSSLV